VDGLVTISAAMTSWAQEEARRLGRQVDVCEVPVLTDTDEQAPEPYPDGPPRVVFAGSPAYDETMRFIFAAMQTVWERFTDCTLVVTGVNPGEPAARWLVREASRGPALAARAATNGNLDERIELPGYLSRAELLHEYASARALLLPLFDDVRSTYRFPTKLGEYLASARPVVGSDAGELRRYLRDGETAYLAPAGDVEAFAAAIVNALGDRARAEQIGAAGRELGGRLMRPEEYTDRLMATFQRVAARRRRKQGGGRRHAEPRTAARG
jgi:glycosyltransferase involved in cell wall biosynthesis